MGNSLEYKIFYHWSGFEVGFPKMMFSSVEEQQIASSIGREGRDLDLPRE